jgi:hypothetical protein
MVTVRSGDRRGAAVFCMALSAVVSLLLPACSGAFSPRPARSSPPNAPTENLTEYVPPSGLYQIEVPVGWARIDSPDGITFSGGLHSIRIEQIPYGSAPTEASFLADELPLLRRTTPGFRLRRTGTTVLRSGTAVVADYTGTATDASSGKPLQRDFRRYEVWHADQRAVLTLVSLGDSAMARAVVESFRWRR